MNFDGKIFDPIFWGGQFLKEFRKTLILDYIGLFINQFLTISGPFLEPFSPYVLTDYDRICLEYVYTLAGIDWLRAEGEKISMLFFLTLVQC